MSTTGVVGAMWGFWGGSQGLGDGLSATPSGDPTTGVRITLRFLIKSSTISWAHLADGHYRGLSVPGVWFIGEETQLDSVKRRATSHPVIGDIQCT